MDEEHCRNQAAECLRLMKLAQSEAEAEILKHGKRGPFLSLASSHTLTYAGATASMKAPTASTPLLLHHRYMVAFPTPARAAKPSIDIWWKPTVFRSSYVASRIALRDTSLRLRPCAAVVDGAAANGDTPGHFETSRFTTRGILRKHCGVARRRSLRRCIFPFTAAPQMTASPWILALLAAAALRGEVARACDHRDGTPRRSLRSAERVEHAA